ncbi:MAG: hypothetical protein ACOYNN_05145 [Terrimicrobiaceae bacterium]
MVCSHSNVVSDRFGGTRHAFARSMAVVFSAIFLASSGCAHKEKPPRPEASVSESAEQKPPFFLAKWMSSLSRLIPKKSKPPVALPPQWAGTIRMVNAGENFILIETNALAEIVPGEVYTAVANGAETATVRMTALRNPPFLIADILTGSPSEGEKIYLPRASAKPTTPAEVKPAPTPRPKPTPKAKPTPGPKPTPKPSKRPGTQTQR